MIDQDAPIAKRRYRHKASGQVHVLLVSELSGAVTVQETLMSGVATHSWLGSLDDFLKDFVPC